MPRSACTGPGPCQLPPAPPDACMQPCHCELPVRWYVAHASRKAWQPVLLPYLQASCMALAERTLNSTHTHARTHQHWEIESR